MDGEVIIIYILMLLIPLVASLNVKSTYKRFKKVKTSTGKTGLDVAKEILKKNGLENVYVVETSGELSDCYDPTRKVVRLSTDVFHGDTVSAISIAAHECGHAIQDKENYSWMRLRSSIFPIVSIGEKLAYVILIVGLILSMMDLIILAIAFTALGLAFQIITLPVEFDASARAKEELNQLGLVVADEENGVKKVLGAAAMTYVAGVLASALDVLYLFLRFVNRD